MMKKNQLRPTFWGRKWRQNRSLRGAIPTNYSFTPIFINRKRCVCVCMYVPVAAPGVVEELCRMEREEPHPDYFFCEDTQN